MNKNILSVGILVAIIIILSGIFIAKKNSNSDTVIPVTPENTTSAAVQTTGSVNSATTTGSTEKSYSIAEVRAHNNQSSCWTAINGSVYDVTAWISQHPGGSQAILSLCGIDGSAAFNGQHGGQARPESELATFKIGAFSK